MKQLEKNEMLNIEGGSSTSLTGSMLTAIYKAINIIYEIGESLGSYIRRVKEGKLCNL